MINTRHKEASSRTFLESYTIEFSIKQENKVHVFYFHMIYIWQENTRQRQPFASGTDKFFNAVLSNFITHHNTKSPLVLLLQDIWSFRIRGKKHEITTENHCKLNDFCRRLNTKDREKIVQESTNVTLGPKVKICRSKTRGRLENFGLTRPTPGLSIMSTHRSKMATGILTNHDILMIMIPGIFHGTKKQISYRICRHQPIQFVT